MRTNVLKACLFTHDTHRVQGSGPHEKKQPVAGVRPHDGPLPAGSSAHSGSGLMSFWFVVIFICLY